MSALKTTEIWYWAWFQAPQAFAKLPLHGSRHGHASLLSSDAIRDTIRPA